MLIQRRRRWTNVETTLGQSVIFAGKWHQLNLILRRIVNEVMAPPSGRLLYLPQASHMTSNYNNYH